MSVWSILIWKSSLFKKNNIMVKNFGKFSTFKSIEHTRWLTFTHILHFAIVGDIAAQSPRPTNCQLIVPRLESGNNTSECVNSLTKLVDSNQFPMRNRISENWEYLTRAFDSAGDGQFQNGERRNFILKRPIILQLWVNMKLFQSRGGGGNSPAHSRLFYWLIAMPCRNIKRQSLIHIYGPGRVCWWATFSLFTFNSLHSIN